MRLIAAKYGPRRFRLSSVSLSHLGMSTHSYPSANGLRMFPKMNLVSCAIVNASKSSFDASLFQFLPPPSLKRTKSANRNRDGDPKSEESEHLRPAKRPRVHNYAPSIAGARLGQIGVLKRSMKSVELHAKRLRLVGARKERALKAMRTARLQVMEQTG